MLRSLLLEELALFALFYDFHYLILCYRQVESMLECFYDDRVP
jgi:hypothetical protein